MASIFSRELKLEAEFAGPWVAELLSDSCRAIGPTFAGRSLCVGSNAAKCLEWVGNYLLAVLSGSGALLAEPGTDATQCVGACRLMFSGSTQERSRG